MTRISHSLLSLFTLFVACGCGDAGDDGGDGDADDQTSGAAVGGGSGGDGDADDQTSGTGGEGPANCSETVELDEDNFDEKVAEMKESGCVERIAITGLTRSDLSGLEFLSELIQLSVGREGRFSWDENIGNPGLTSLKGLKNLKSSAIIHIIGNPELTDITALSSVTEVNGEVRISTNSKLGSLEGLHNITEFDDLIVEKMHALADLKGLRGAQSINSLVLEYNSLLTNCEGLDSVQWFGSWTSSIGNNENMVDLTGLGSLRSIGAAISIYNNAALTSFSGLENLERFGWSLNVLGNPELADIGALSTVNEIKSEVSFSGNPKLPQCAIDAFLEPLDLPCDCADNDEAAACD